jgi:cerevisin
LSDSGFGVVSDIIASITWVVSAVPASGRPSIATIGLGSSANGALNAAVDSAISKDILFVVAARNSAVDADKSHQGKLASTIMVGVADASDQRANFSNYGLVVDIYALGMSTLCPWSSRNTVMNTISGTTVAM